jgi:glucose-6-phosphate isomerase
MENLEKWQGAKYLFVIGIGGSNLASKAVWEAMSLHKKTSKKIFFLESPDSREYEEIERFVKDETANPEEVVLIVASKSGKTTETLEAFHKVFDMLSEKFGAPINERVIIVSETDTPLWKLAEQKEIARFEWKKDVGGRFSAFGLPHTAVLQIADINIADFKKGGEEAMNSTAEEWAKDIFKNYNEGADILDFFFFNSELESLGKWCRQLLAESLGKQNKKGERVGLTPTVSLGPVDLHSMLQLSLGGPKNRFTIFVRSLHEIKDSVNESAYEDTLKAYDKSGLSFKKYEIPEINEFELGKFMAFMMVITLELAELLLVNPYNQPEVEEYKKNLNS